MNAQYFILVLLAALAAGTGDARSAAYTVGPSLKLNITVAGLPGKVTLWRLASFQSAGQNPSLSNSPDVSVPGALTLPRFSASLSWPPGRS